MGGTGFTVVVATLLDPLPAHRTLGGPVRGGRPRPLQPRRRGCVELARLVAGEVRSAVLRTETTIDGGDEPAAATGWFSWSVRLAPSRAVG